MSEWFSGLRPEHYELSEDGSQCNIRSDAPDDEQLADTIQGEGANTRTACQFCTPIYGSRARLTQSQIDAIDPIMGPEFDPKENQDITGNGEGDGLADFDNLYCTNQESSSLF